MRSRLWWAAAAIGGALVGGLAPPASAGPRTPAEHGRPLPVVYSGAAAFANASARPDTSPAGANDWSCRPSRRHPRPVVLVHGTIENMTYNWYTLAPLLANHGYCVYAFTYGQEPGVHAGLPGSARAGGVAPVADSAWELARFVRRVRRAAGTSRVDIVGHSQGGMMPRYYMRFLGGAAHVRRLVALSPSNHGTTADGLARLPGVPYLLTTALGPSVHDQIKGSAFLRRLNRGGDTVRGIAYTVIETRYDEVVTPYRSAFLKGPRVRNILLQRQCPADAADHLGISFDANALHDVLNALDPAHATPVRCRPALPVNGG